MTSAETTDKAAAVAAQGAQVAPGQAPAKKAAKPARKSAAPHAESKGPQILDMIARAKGATLAEFMPVIVYMDYSSLYSKPFRAH
jgi:hypothetical protein